MGKEISVKTASGRKLYKISQSGGYFYCYKYSDSFFGSWSNIGHAHSFEDALTLVWGYASSKYGKIYDVQIG